MGVSDRIRLGTQGWNYRAWVGPFYPQGTKAAGMLAHYSRVFATIELDATFYGTPAAAVLEGWRAQVPEGFQFALRMPQQITHEARLSNVDRLLERFTDRVRLLGPAAGPVLIQLSPDFHPSAEHRGIFKLFLSRLADDLRWAVEFRHHAWITDDILETLGRHDVALSLADGRWHRRERMLELAARPTANFAYVRWMGFGRDITDFSTQQRDRTQALKAWARALESLLQSVDTVYGYFNNQFEGHGPKSVQSMQQLLGSSRSERSPAASRQSPIVNH